MSNRTVIAVSYGDSGFGQPISCEVFTVDPMISSERLSEAVAGHCPRPGELDDPRLVRKRYERLQDMGGRVEAVPSHAIAMAEAATGGAGRQVVDADYAEAIGQVLVFDAEVDDRTGEVDWYTATPTCFTDPLSLPGARGADPGTDKVYRRLDGALLSTRCLRQRQHLVRVDPDGRFTPVNEFGQSVGDLSEDEWSRYWDLDLSHLETDTMVICARPSGPGGVKMTCQRLVDVQAGRALLDPLASGFDSRSVDYEVLRESAGDNQSFVTDPSGDPMWVAVVDVDRVPVAEGFVGNIPVDALSARPTDRHLPRLEAGFDRRGAPVVRLDGAQTSRDQVSMGLLGSLSSPPSPAPARHDPGPDTTRPAPARGPASEKFSTGARDLLASRQSGTGSPGTGQRLSALAGMNASVRTAAAMYGPRLLEPVKQTLNDPQVRQDLKKAAVVGLEAAVTATGGGRARGAAAVGALARLEDLPTARRVRQSPVGRLGLEHLKNLERGQQAGSVGRRDRDLEL